MDLVRRGLQVAQVTMSARRPAFPADTALSRRTTRTRTDAERPELPPEIEHGLPFGRLAFAIDPTLTEVLVGRGSRKVDRGQVLELVAEQAEGEQPASLSAKRDVSS